jgi:hypothetical protein
LADRREFNARILKDVTYNGDGLSLILVDPLAPMTNLHLNCMAVGHVLNMIDMFFSSASECSRMWLHTRMATTDFVGVPFNHGFTDSHGTMIQHNGVIRNYRNLAVDSFNLVDYRTDTAKHHLEDLETAGEYFANIFLVRPEQGSYSVIRVGGGMLFTDRQGNYSTNAVADIRHPVLTGYAKDYRIIGGMVPVAQPIKDDYDSDTEFAWDSVAHKYTSSGK